MESPAEIAMEYGLTMIERRFRFLSKLVVAVGILVGAGSLAAHEFAVRTDLLELQSPTGIAIRPSADSGVYEIFVAEVGAGRVARIQSSKPSVAHTAITGFISSSDLDEPIYLPGPHGLLFLDSTRLVVTGSAGHKTPFVRLYELSDPNKTLSAERYEQQTEPAASDDVSNVVVSNYQRVARTHANDQVSDYLVLSANGKATGASVWRLPVRGGTLGDLKLLGKNRSGQPPVAVAVEPRGYIIVTRPGEQGDSASSRVEFINPIDGRTALEVTVNLPDILDLAYSPRTGSLYAATRSVGDAQRRGIYRIDSRKRGDIDRRLALATKVVDVENPTAVAFGPDGALYITTVEKTGVGGALLKVTGDF
jgi:hypothetical protein